MLKKEKRSQKQVKKRRRKKRARKTKQIRGGEEQARPAARATKRGRLHAEAPKIALAQDLPNTDNQGGTNVGRRRRGRKSVQKEKGIHPRTGSKEPGRKRRRKRSHRRRGKKETPQNQVGNQIAHYDELRFVGRSRKEPRKASERNKKPKSPKKKKHKRQRSTVFQHAM